MAKDVVNDRVSASGCTGGGSCRNGMRSASSLDVRSGPILRSLGGAEIRSSSKSTIDCGCDLRSLAAGELRSARRFRFGDLRRTIRWSSCPAFSKLGALGRNESSARRMPHVVNGSLAALICRCFLYSCWMLKPSSSTLRDLVRLIAGVVLFSARADCFVELRS